MVHQNFQIVRLHVGVLGRAPEKIVRMLHDELIERRGRRHQHRARSLRCAVPRVPPAATWTRSIRHIPPSRTHRASRYRCPIPAHSSPPLRACAPRAARARFRAARPANIRRDSRESAPPARAAAGLACCKYVSSTSVCSRLLANTIVCSLRASSSFATRVVSFR